MEFTSNGLRQSEIPVHFCIKECIWIDAVCGVYLKFKFCTEQALQIGCFHLEKSLTIRTLFIPQHKADFLIVVIEVLLKKRNDFIPEDLTQGLDGRETDAEG